MNIVEFFKDRVAHFDEERRIFNDYINLIMPDKMECHNLEWENRKLVDTASSAKASGDTVDAEIAKVRAQIMSCKSEITMLKASKETRIQQIARLSELSQPVQHDTTYLVTERFNNSTKKPTGKTYDPIRNNNPYKLPRTGEVTKLEVRLNEETIRTSSYLQELNVVLRSIEEQRFQLDEAGSAEVQGLYAAAQSLLVEDDKYDVQCFLAVAELLRLRLRIMVAQREEVEELARLQVDRSYFTEKEERTREQLLTDMSMMKRRIKAELDESNADFQRQIYALDSKLKALHDREREINHEHSKTHLYEERLNAALAEIQDKYRKLRRRNALEIEGYQCEAAQLKTRLEHVEKLFRWQQLRNATNNKSNVYKT